MMIIIIIIFISLLLVVIMMTIMTMMMSMSMSSYSGRVVHDDGAVVRAVVCGAWRGQLSVVYVLYQVRQLLHQRRHDARDAVSGTEQVG